MKSYIHYNIKMTTVLEKIEFVAFLEAGISYKYALDCLKIQLVLLMF